MTFMIYIKLCFCPCRCILNKHEKIVLLKQNDIFFPYYFFLSFWTTQKVNTFKKKLRYNYHTFIEL